MIFYGLFYENERFFNGCFMVFLWFLKILKVQFSIFFLNKFYINFYINFI